MSVNKSLLSIHIFSLYINDNRLNVIHNSCVKIVKFGKFDNLISLHEYRFMNSGKRTNGNIQNMRIDTVLGAKAQGEKKFGNMQSVIAKRFIFCGEALGSNLSCNMTYESLEIISLFISLFQQEKLVSF